MEKRFCFVQDEDSHWYMIDPNAKKLFNKLLYDEDNTGKESWERDEWQQFEYCRLDGGIERYTFSNPIEE